MAQLLPQCDGTSSSPGVPSQYPTACLPYFLGEETDLEFCECHVCQVYDLKSYVGGPIPKLENSIATTTLQPGVESVHTLCLNHWTFLEINLGSAPNYVQSWSDPEISEPSTISAAQGSQSIAQQLVLTLDTAYDAVFDRFTTVDAFLHTSAELPANWHQVHTGSMTPGGTNEDYPRLVFFPGDSPDMSNHVQFIQRDSFIYTSGYDDAAPGCASKLPARMYLAVRCGNPTPSKGSWQRQDKPCSFRVRYVMLPQQLMGGDSIGPIPMGASSTHAYSVVVGGYDVMRFHIRRIGPNITDSCNGRMQDCLDKVHWLTGQAFTAVDRCPTRGGQLSELTNETTTLTKEWFCTGPGEEGRYYLALRSAALLDPRGPVPGYLMWDGTTPSSELLVPQQGLAGNQLKEARGYYTLSVYHRAFFEGPLRPGEAREGCVSFGQWRQFTVVTSGATDASLYLSAAAVDEAGNELAARGMPLSSMYARRNRAPTRQTHDVATHHPSDALSSSPCDPTEPYEYHVAIYLDAYLPATAMGLGPAYFAITPRLLSAAGPTYGTADWPKGNASLPIALPLSSGGGGHVCCQQFRYWVLRQVPPDVEPIVIINMSSRSLAPPALAEQPSPPSPPPPELNASSSESRAKNQTMTMRVQGLFLKRASCPSSADVTADHSGCGGRCRLSWLARYDSHSGVSTFMPSTTVHGGLAPLGVELTPEDWIIGVQALKDEHAEFTLRLASRPRPALVKKTVCSRLTHFCTTDVLNATTDSIWPTAASAASATAPQTSGAASRRLAGRGRLPGFHGVGHACVAPWSGQLWHLLPVCLSFIAIKCLGTLRHAAGARLSRSKDTG